MAETLYLIDGSSILYRAFFAIRGLSTKAGMPTNAIFGTIKMVEKLVRERTPSRLAVVFDLPGPTFRHEAYAEYKANRPEMPSEMASQIEPAKAILRAMGLPLVELAGYEADDCIATLAKAAVQAGLEVVIVTADKDLFQLVRPGVRILHTKREDTLLDEKGVEEVFGVPPERVVDVLALWGDPTDNIPGVPGIGEKGAKDLVRTYGSLDEVLAHGPEITRKAYREGLQQHAEAARFSRELATVKDDAPLETSLEALAIEPPDRESLNALFREYEFGSLIQEAEAPAAETIRVDSLAFDEEASKVLRKASGVGCALSGGDAWLSDGERAWTAPIGSLPWNSLMDLPLCVHGFKGLLHGIGDAAPLSERPGMDSAIAGYLIDPSASVPSLAKLAGEFLGQGSPDDDPGTQALLLARLKAPLEDRLRDLGMEGLYREVEWPLIGILARMERTGIGVDLDYFQELGRDLDEALSTLLAEIHRAAGLEFNVASPKQVGEVLFEKLGLPVLKKTSKTKSYSTDSEVLEGLKAAHPVVPLILEYRMLSKLRGTYVEPLPSWVNPETGRIHAQFHQTVAATGRLSSSDPNLQNIPVRGEWGGRIRHGFLAPEGRLFAGADYSQIELRVLAHLCRDPALLRVFERGEDIHTSTAAEVFDVAPPFVTADMRRQAKAINFGILYGMGPFGLSRELGVPQKESKAFIARYFARFPMVRSYLDGVEREVMEKEQVSTLLGRRRLFPGISKAAKPLQQALLRQAVNTTVQGSAADLIKKAMVAADKRLPADSPLVLQVHDELILESPQGGTVTVGQILKEAMEGAMTLRVPLVVSLSTGRRWSDLK